MLRVVVKTLNPNPRLARGTALVVPAEASSLAKEDRYYERCVTKSLHRFSHPSGIGTATMYEVECVVLHGVESFRVASNAGGPTWT